MIELIEDYIKRSKVPLITTEKVLSDMQQGMTFVDKDGFLVINRNDNELYVAHCYAKPGNKKLFRIFINITDELARHFKCRAILFATMRPKGFNEVLNPFGYKPTNYVVFRKELI